MPPLALLPYLAAAYGGYQGYRGAKEAGASGLGRILGGITGAYSGYTLGSMAPGAVPYSQLGQNFAALRNYQDNSIATATQLASRSEQQLLSGNQNVSHQQYNKTK